MVRALRQLNVYRTIQKGCLYSGLLRSEKQLNLRLGVCPSSAWLLLRWPGLKGQDPNTPCLICASHIQMVNLECLCCVCILRFFQSILLSVEHKHCVFALLFVRQPFSKPQIASFKALQRRIWWFCKGQKETHVSLVSASSGIIWTYCEGNAASVWTLKRFRRTRTDVTKWNRVEAPPLRADRRATRQHELFLLIKIHEHVSVFVCLLDSLREQMKTVPML